MGGRGEKFLSASTDDNGMCADSSGDAVENGGRI